MEGSLALITGAAGDIGQAVARRLASTHRLALVDHPTREAILVEQASELDAWNDVFDITDAAAVSAAVDRLVDECGAPMALFNNAGVQGPFVPIDAYPLDAAARVFSVNVIGAFNVLAVVGAAMANGGAVVNMASMAGVGGAPNMSAYSASKAAIIGLTKSAAKDLAPRQIRVNATSPAFIGPGAMWDNQVAQQAAAGTQYFPDEPDAVAAQMIGSVPLRRYGALDEVASVVEFLLSDAASYLTGVNIEISGGAA